MRSPSGSHGVEVASSQFPRTTLGRSLRPQVPPSPPETALHPFLPGAKAVLTDGPEASPALLLREVTSREGSSGADRNLHANSLTVCARAHARARTWAGPRSQVPPSGHAFPLPLKGGTGRPRETWVSGAPLNSAAGMARLRSVVLRPWIRELVLGLERLSSPRAGQLLQVSPPTPWGPGAGVGPQGGGIDAVAVVRCCRRRKPRPQARPAPLTGLMSGPRCLCPTGPTASGAW